MIAPFSSELVNGGGSLISYGVSSYGYDARLADEFKVFTPAGGPVIDPKAFDPAHFEAVTATDHLDIPPHGFVLGRTVERFKIPRNVMAICFAKSTYARCGIVVGVTPIEPEFEGTVTLEFSNTTDKPARIYVGEGICQFVFLTADEPCATSYADRKGKYQGQTGVTLARV
jgi:dCTP deaminase